MNASRLPTIFAPLGGLALLGLLLAIVTGCGSGQTNTAGAKSSERSTAQSPEEDAKALGVMGNRSWYDPATGEYRPPKVSEEVDHPLRRSGTFAGPSTPKPATGGGRGGSWNWPSGETIGYIMLIALGTALIGVAIFLLMASLRSWLPGRSLNELTHKPIQIDPARVADLPFEAQSEMQDPLAYARHLIAQGKFDEAVIFIYGYMLLALDRAGKITLHRGKTNRMYLQELAGEMQLRDMLTPAMLAFEDVFFGRHSIEPERFRKIWDELDAFHRALAPAIAAAPPPPVEGVAP